MVGSSVNGCHDQLLKASQRLLAASNNNQSSQSLPTLLDVRNAKKAFDNIDTCDNLVRCLPGNVKSLIDLYNYDLWTKYNSSDTQLTRPCANISGWPRSKSEQNLCAMSGYRTYQEYSLLAANGKVSAPTLFGECERQNKGVITTRSAEPPSSLAANGWRLKGDTVANKHGGRFALGTRGAHSKGPYHEFGDFGSSRFHDIQPINSAIQLSACKRRQLFRRNRNLSSPPLVSISVESQASTQPHIVLLSEELAPQQRYGSSSTEQCGKSTKRHNQSGGHWYARHKAFALARSSSASVPKAAIRHNNVIAADTGNWTNTVQRLRAMFSKSGQDGKNSSYYRMPLLKSSKISVQVGEREDKTFPSYEALKSSNSERSSTDGRSAGLYRSTLYLDNTRHDRPLMCPINVQATPNISENIRRPLLHTLNSAKKAENNVRGRSFFRIEIPAEHRSKLIRPSPFRSNCCIDVRKDIQPVYSGKKTEQSRFNLRSLLFQPRSRSNQWSDKLDKSQFARDPRSSRKANGDSDSSSSSSIWDSCIGNSLSSENLRPAAAIQSLNNYESDDSVCGIPKPLRILSRSTESVMDDVQTTDEFCRTFKRAPRLNSRAKCSEKSSKRLNSDASNDLNLFNKPALLKRSQSHRVFANVGNKTFSTLYNC